MKRIFLCAICLALMLMGCSGRGPKVASLLGGETEQDPLSAANDAIDNIGYDVRRLDMDLSSENYMALKTDYDNLCQFDIEPSDFAEDQRAEARKVSFRLDSVKQAVAQVLNDNLRYVRQDLVAESDHLVNGVAEYPVYLQRGSKLYIDLNTTGGVTAKLYNVDSRQLVKNYAGKKVVKDSVTINNSAIYLLELTTKGAQYIDLSLRQNVGEVDQLGVRHALRVDTMDCLAKDFRAQKVNGIQMQNLFKEPRKITLRSQGKAFFSGSSRSVVAVQIPAGTTDLLYNFRISTNEGDRSSDGQFCRNMDSTYRRIKFLGLPVYESQGSKSSLLRELLNCNTPVREEDAYCNMYVFKSADQAKKFQDGQNAADLKYDIDRSTMGTQSCNGCISVKGMRTIYLGFENERFRYSNYLWLDVIAVVPHTEYYTLKYRLVD